MPFKSRRQGRYDKLLNSGFQKGEAYALSKMSPHNVILNDLILQRAQDLKGTRNKAEAIARIKEIYRQNGWVKPGTGIIKGKTQTDIWKMFRYYVELYKKYNPDYGVRSKVSDFVNKPYDPTKKRQKR
jgi:hypothetical protein